VVAIQSKSKLNIRFHNPNTPEATAEYIVKIFMEVNQKRIDEILKEEASNQSCMDTKDKSCCAG
jgi:hypothetical protein